MTRPGLPGLENQFVVNIDHHSTTELFGDVNWIDSTAAAVGEMIYNLAKAIGARINPELAELRLCGTADRYRFISLFKHHRTHVQDRKRAGHATGHSRPSSRKRSSIPIRMPRSRLVGEVLSTLQRDDSGRIAWISMSKEAMEGTGATEDDSDGIINYPLTVGEVEAVAFFRELSNSTFRISLRSKNRVNVARVAEAFGGGGHCNAAGFTVSADFDELSKSVIERLKEAVSIAPAANGREIKPR